MSMMDMLFKQLKIKPEEIQQQIAATAEGFKQTVAHFNKTLARIEANQQLIMDKLGIEQESVPNHLAVLPQEPGR